VESASVPLENAPGPGGAEQPVQLRYKTAEGEQRRTTFANVIPRGPDLWVVSLSVWTVEEDDGKKNLFDKVAPSFGFA
jgi:hypothetical protein